MAWLACGSGNAPIATWRCSSIQAISSRNGFIRRFAAPMPGGVRFYLISDDNFGTYDGKPTDQKTLLLAYDWIAPK